MAQEKKLQVFVSSTYTDLREERQAAVEAILTAGHIPAGMELFAAGDESQMNAIKRWIDESDVFLLILGGRYGSLETKSQKSYIHIEYEYAVERGKPLFAVVIGEEHLEEKIKEFGSEVIEREHPQKLKEFRALVLTKMVRFWSDPRDIKLAIMETLADFSRREDLLGWIPGDEAVNAGPQAEEIARLTKENRESGLGKQRLATPVSGSVIKLSDQEATSYFLSRLKEAEKDVCDLTYEDFTGRLGEATMFFGSGDRDKYRRIIREVSKDVKYREIMMFRGSKSSIEKAKWLMTNSGKYYQLAGYADLAREAPPRHNFAIIDDEVFVKGWVIREPKVVDYFRQFYQELWDKAIPIKVSTVVNLELIEEAERKLASQENGG